MKAKTIIIIIVIVLLIGGGAYYFWRKTKLGSRNPAQDGISPATVKGRLATEADLDKAMILVSNMNKQGITPDSDLRNETVRLSQSGLTLLYDKKEWKIYRTLDLPSTAKLTKGIWIK